MNSASLTSKGNRVLLVGILGVILNFMISGCGKSSPASTPAAATTVATDVDVTGDPKYLGGFSGGADYMTQQDLFITNPGKAMKSIWPEDFKTPYGSSGTDFYTTPTLTAFKAKPEDWPWLSGIIPAGTRLHLAHLIIHLVPQFTTMRVQATIMSGDFTGQEVDISLLTSIPEGNLIRGPQSKYLVPAK